MCGVFKRSKDEEVEIGFAFLPGHCGKGYGFEIANATLVHATKQHNLTKVSAITISENIPSIRLLENLGFTFSKKTKTPDNKDELLQYHYVYA